MMPNSLAIVDDQSRQAKLSLTLHQCARIQIISIHQGPLNICIQLFMKYLPARNSKHNKGRVIGQLTRTVEQSNIHLAYFNAFDRPEGRKKLANLLVGLAVWAGRYME